MPIVHPRDTAQQSAKNFLQIFKDTHTKFQHRIFLEDSFEMIERELAGYLSNPHSIYREMFNAARGKLFKGGLVFGRENGIFPGHDLLLAMASISDKIKQFENPEFGIRDIVGYELTLQLFFLRNDILNHLVKFDFRWHVNLVANKAALENLIKHPQPTPKKTKKILFKENVTETKPSLKISDITLARIGILSFFYDSHPDHKQNKVSNNNRTTTINPKQHLTKNHFCTQYKSHTSKGSDEYAEQKATIITTGKPTL